MEEETKIKSVHESIFAEAPDPLSRPEDQQYIDMASDAYIWIFTGPRGAGKTLAMSYFAVKARFLYGMRLVSNFPLAFNLIRIDGTSEFYEAEPLDLYKLLCFDSDYHHCLVLMDEAPDIISHMASMTWKNRLLNVFVRQLRKNMNSLFLGAQQFTLIDKSMRWQTDVICRCQDAFRKYGGSRGLVRGACILLDIYDNSGQWTGQMKTIAHDGQLAFIKPDDSLELVGRTMWGVFDTHYQQDVFESLKRVDMKLDTYQIGGAPVDADKMIKCAELISAIKEDGGKVLTTELWDSLNVTKSEKNKMGEAWRHCGVKRVGGSGKFYDVSEFDIDAFLQTMLGERGT